MGLEEATFRCGKVEFIVMAVFGCIVFFKGIRTAGGENGHRKRTNLEP